MKKKLAIVFGITKDYSFALGNVLIGMKKHCKIFWDDIIVFHDGLCEKDRTNLSLIYPCIFKTYDVSNMPLKVNQDSLKAYSYLALARFECFDMLNEYEYVIWHDVDILVQKDFSELIHVADNSGFALTCNPQFYTEQNFIGIVQGYDLLRPIYNSGLMVLKDNLQDYNLLRRYCYEKFEQYSDKIRYLDQAVLNLMIQDFSINVGYIDLNKFCCHPSELNYKEATIVHAYGKDKFWNSSALKIQFPEWVSNDCEWNRISTGKIENNEIIFCDSFPNNPKISVVMSIYERSDYMYEAIESILSQTFSDFELIIVIEKSNSQKEICDKIEKKYPDKRIKLICNEEKLGFAKSLNVGIEAAKGEYIARMDDDDISLPERFQKQVAFLDNNKNIDILGSYIKMFMNCNDECTVPTEYEELRVRALNETPIYHPTVMMRKQSLDQNNLRYSSEYMTEDFDLWCRAIKILKFANIPEVLLLYRASGQNATATKADKVLKSHIDIVKRNFKENLNIELTHDEVILLERPDILNNCYNMLQFAQMRDELLERIIKTNRKEKVYDCKIFERRFVTYNPGFTMRMTRRLQKYPILLKAAKLAYGIISTNGEYSYLFHSNIKRGISG